MALSDCERCWDTPCTCGYHWREHSMKQMVKTIVPMLNFKSIDEAHVILNECLDELKQRKDG